MSPVLAFDIETIPDCAGMRVLRGADPALSDAEVHAAEIADRAARNKSVFLPPHLQRVLVVSCVFRGNQGLQRETSRNLEAGVEFAHGPWTVQAAVFQRTDDELVDKPNDPVVGAVTATVI